MFEDLRTADRARRPLRYCPPSCVLYDCGGGYYAVMHPMWWRHPGNVLRWCHTRSAWFLQGPLR